MMKCATYLETEIELTTPECRISNRFGKIKLTIYLICHITGIYKLSYKYLHLTSGKNAES